MLKKLNIFVHRASECLTDYESHGDGLICFSLLNGLAERGHHVYAYTNVAFIHQCSPNLHIKTGQHRVPANSLGPWEQAWRAEQWMKEVERTTKIDLVWRMHPYGAGCPTVPKTGGRPLVIGPLFYGWPKQEAGTPKLGQPRFGVGLQNIVGPVAERGWEQTLDRAALILCATGPHAELIYQQNPKSDVMKLPVIVEAPTCSKKRALRDKTYAREKRVFLLFVANLVTNKNPQIFCDTVRLLRDSGINATGTLLGDGPERGALEAYCDQAGIKNSVCFRGKVPNVEVYKALSEADFLVSTSYGEPYGRGIAEAMSVGTPAVCHRSGGPADYIHDGQDGLLVNDLSAKAYAARLQVALSNPDTCNWLSANAHYKAQGWRTNAVMDKLESALQNVIGNQH